MYRYIFLFALVSYACAASIGSVQTPTEKREVIPVLKFETDKQPDGSFRFLYEGGDQSFREETGVVENAGTEDETLEVHGSYRYIDADGQEIEVHYTAGKNGFVPVGTNIPSSISALAKAAADQPNDPVEEQSNRRARSKVETEDVKKLQTKVETLKRSETPEKVKKTADVKKQDKVVAAKPVATEQKKETVPVKTEETKKPAAEAEKVSEKKDEKVAATSAVKPEKKEEPKVSDKTEVKEEQMVVSEEQKDTKTEKKDVKA